MPRPDMGTVMVAIFTAVLEFVTYWFVRIIKGEE
jgi:hypothetical protein